MLVRKTDILPNMMVIRPSESSKVLSAILVSSIRVVDTRDVPDFYGSDDDDGIMTNIDDINNKYKFNFRSFVYFYLSTIFKIVSCN